MPRTLSFNARRQMAAEHADDVPIVLLTLTHEDLPSPLRLSSDPTQRLSVDPLTYGTVSQGNDFLFVIMSAVLPDEKEDAPPRSAIVFDNLDHDIVAAIRASTSPARVDLRLVLASTPDLIEEEYLDFAAVSARYDAAQVEIELSREPFTTDPFPAFRMSKTRFPGLIAG